MSSGGKKYNKHKKQKGGDFGDLFGVQRNVSSNNEPTTLQEPPVLPIGST